MAVLAQGSHLIPAAVLAGASVVIGALVVAAYNQRKCERLLLELSPICELTLRFHTELDWQQGPTLAPKHGAQE